MNSEINITGCIDCPFAQLEYDDYSVNFDTTAICGLSKYLGYHEYIIDSYNRIDDCKYCEELKDYEEFDETKCTCNHKIKTPEWCPILNSGININMK